jgi:hypothetical protein
LLLSVGKLGHGATLSKLMGLVRCCHLLVV